MPRIIVTTDPASPSTLGDASVLLSESVNSVHLSTDHAAGQLVERLAWAITDAERAELAAAKRSPERITGRQGELRRRSSRARDRLAA